MGRLIFRLPLDGNPKISSPYGTRVDPIKDSLIVKADNKKMRNPFASPLRFHSGIDYAVDIGSPVKASERGRVVRAAWHEALGELVIIDHAPNARKGTKYIYTMYAHLSKFGVTLGADVKKGQEIGSSGNTGRRSTGAHLHFSIIESNTKLTWGTTGSTGYDPTPSLFKNPENYYDQAVEVESSADDFTDEEMDRFYKDIMTDLRLGSRPTLLVNLPNYREFIRTERGEYPPQGVKPPKITLQLENAFSPEFRLFFPSLELEVNGINLGRIQTDTKVYELDIWNG